MKRRMAVVALGVIASMASPSAAAAERVVVSPVFGDANTTFVFRGWGWRPGAHLEADWGALCGAYEPCHGIGYSRQFQADRRGRFEFRHYVGFAPKTWVGTSYCFRYRPTHRCLVTAPIAVAPPWATVTPATLRRDLVPPRSYIVTLTVGRFLAGSRLTIELQYPNGRVVRLRATTRRRGGHVRLGYAQRGGPLLGLRLAPADPDGHYIVRVSSRGAEARSSFEVGSP